MISYKELSRKLKLMELCYTFSNPDPLIDFLDDVKKKSRIEKISTHRYILLINDITVSDIYYTRENYNLRIEYINYFPIGEKITKDFTELYFSRNIKTYARDKVTDFINNRKEFLQNYMTDYLIKPMLKKIPDAKL